MRKISVINLKGGVGKTTTVINLSFALSMKDKRVLLLDLDPQANLTLSLMVPTSKNMFDLLINNVDVSEVITKCRENIDIIPSKDLDKAEIILAGLPSRETVLKRVMEPVFNYDYVLIDCPPSSGLLNYNALLYSNEAIVPVSTDYLGLVGLRKVVELIEKINEVFNHNVTITTIVPTMFDARSKISKQTLDEIKLGFNGEVVNPIRVNTKMKEMPKLGVSIFELERKFKGATDYLNLADKIINDELNYF